MRYTLTLCVVACTAAAWFGVARVGSEQGLGQRLVPLAILSTLIPLALLAIASWRTGSARMVKWLWITAIVAAPLLVGAGIHRLDWSPGYRVEAYLLATITALLAAVLASAIRAWPAHQQPIPVAIVKHDGE